MHTHIHTNTHIQKCTHTHIHIFFIQSLWFFFCVYNKVDKKSEEAKRDKCKNMTLKINISTLIINKEVLSLTANSS